MYVFGISFNYVFCIVKKNYYFYSSILITLNIKSAARSYSSRSLSSEIMLSTCIGLR